MLAVGAGGGCLDIFSLVCHFSFFLPLSGRRPDIDEILSQRAVKPKTTNQLLSLHFSSKISPQPFKIETSNLVCRFTTTSYNVGLKMDILLFVLPCIFLSLYIFYLRYQP